ncbi:MAG: hypothetical protein M3526_01870 [Actinomycetota bacterium]|nr:hypothetical protein [Actinomycetota bacterium]
MTSAGDWLRRITIVVTARLLAGALGPIDAGGAAQEELPLAPPGLEEKRVATRLAPGVTHTMIERGHRSPSARSSTWRSACAGALERLRESPPTATCSW